MDASKKSDSHQGGWKKRLNGILANHTGKRVNGNVASQSTITSMGQALYTCFNDLYGLGYKLQDPANIDITTPEQRQVFHYIKQNMKGKSTTEHIGWKITARGKEASLA